MSQKSRNKRIAFVAAIMALLINYPLLSISGGEGLSLILPYIMIVWFVVIMLYYIITESSAKAESKDKT